MIVDNPWLLESVLAHAPLSDIETTVEFVMSTGVLEPGSDDALRRGLRHEIARGEITGPQLSMRVCGHVFACSTERGRTRDHHYALGQRLWDAFVAKRSGG